jgi:hypothetical protein
MADTPSGAQGKHPDPTGRFGEGAPDEAAAVSPEPSHKGDSEQHESRSAGPSPRVGDGEDTADRPPLIDRSQDNY